MANPLSSSYSYRGLLPRPGTFGLRSMHMMRLCAGLAPLVGPGGKHQARVPYRGFGTGGISRSLLANREAAANRNPTSATAQNAFYQVLLKANMPAIVVERVQSSMCFPSGYG
jgi:ATP-dependent metalloprotease